MIAPFAPLRIDHVVLRVQDLARSERFFVEVIGCRVERRREDRGLLHLRAGASQIDLVSVAGPLGQRGGAAAGETGRNVDHVCLRIAPFDEAALLAHLAAHGAPVLSVAKANFGAEGTGPSIYVQDPDGNAIELKGPADASGPAMGGGDDGHP